jgi:predicted ABC-type ATPase
MMMGGALRKPIGGFVPSHGQRETGPGDPVVADDIYEDSVAKFIRFRIDKEMPEDNKKQAKAVFQLLLDDYPASSLGWILAAHWEGPVEIPTDEIDSSNRDSWRASHDGTHESFKQKVGAALEGKSGGIRKPAVLVKVPGEAKYKIVDGHHRFLAHESLGAPLLAYVAEMHVHNGPWDELHTLQKKGKSGARSGSVREPSWAGANAPAPEPRKDDGDFDESKHPRAPDGRFGEGGEGSKEAKAPSGHIEGKRTWTDKVPDGMQDETWKAHYDKHPDKGGKASPERQRDVHEPIIKAALNEAKPASPVEQKIAIMTMGAPASGKSSALRGVDSSRFVKIDADAIKENLPEYQKAIADKDATYKGAAAMAHEESSAISREILKRAIASGHHVIIDGTGKDSDAFMRKMRMLQAAGYHVHVVMPHVEEEDGIKRLKSRAEATGRMVPEHFARDAYKTIPKNFERIAREADSFKLFDNSGKEAKPVWEGGKGKADTVHDKDFVEKFRSQHHDAGDFDEEKHPRASNGQFGEGGGEGGSPKAGSAEKYFAADKGRLGRLRDYTDFDYAKMNEFKRDPLKFAQAHGEKAADAQKAKADAFLQDLKGAPKSPGVALRGVQLSPDAIAKFKPGADTVARGFWSATSDTSQAEGFSKQTAAGAVKKVSGDKTAVLHITHQSGVSLGKASSRPEEKEVVIPHGTSFHVDKVETKGGVHHIYLTEKTRAS